jgi:competence protein ComEC
VKILSFLLVLLISPPLPSPTAKALFVLWDVGQGAWATLITHKECIHFDMGGEKNPTNKVRLLCKKKSNKIFLSHSDYDHRSWLHSFPLSLCRLNKLRPEIESKWSRWTNLKFCTSDEVQVIFKGDLSSKNSNDSSQVAWVPRFKILIPGDSTSKQEKTWAQTVDPSVRYLILGHHGSKTSTSEVLLMKLPNLIQAFASARKLKYGHPHPEVVRKLTKYRIPLLTTEDWGSIVIKD